MKNIGRWWAGQSKGTASAKPALPALSLRKQGKALYILHNRLFNNSNLLSHFFEEGLRIKASLEMHSLRPNLKNIPVSGLAIFASRHEEMESGRRVPLHKLQQQAWTGLRGKARYFPSELSAPAGGNIAQGIFIGPKALQELYALLEIIRPITEETVEERMRIAVSKAFKADIVTKDSLGQSLRGGFENRFIYEIKTFIAVALTCFGGPRVFTTLIELTKEQNAYAEELRSIVWHILYKMNRFSALSCGVMYGDNVPEEFQDDLARLRNSGFALKIIDEIDHFHDHPKNNRYFRKVPTKLSDHAEQWLGVIASSPNKKT